MCVPSAVGAGDRYDVWVWASPEESFHAIEDFIKGGDYEARTVHAGPSCWVGDGRQAEAGAILGG
jgi:hypothetical protein